MEVILIKLGGSLITNKNKPLAAKEKTILRLMREIKVATRKLGKKGIIVGHGSGSFGHYAAERFGLKTLGGIAQVHNTAAELNRIVARLGNKIGLPLLSFPPSTWILARNSQPKKVFIKPIRLALQLGFVPLVFGDVIVDIVQKATIFSTEKVFAALIPQLIKLNFSVSKIIHCGITDGVYDVEGKTIKVINVKNFNSIKESFKEVEGFDVTGGMAHKVEESLKLVEKYNLTSVIINGKRKGELKKAILGKSIKGTLIQKS